MKKTKNYINLFAIEQHSVDLVDGLVGGFLGLEVDESVALGGSGLVLGNLTAENVTEGREGVVHGLVVDVLIEVLYEDVAHARSAEGRVALGPHYADGTALYGVEVHGVEGSFGCKLNQKFLFYLNCFFVNYKIFLIIQYIILKF